MIKLKAPAKINLCLDILSTLDNGYHSVWMVMQTIGLYDTICVEKTDTQTIEIDCDKPNIPVDKRNIAWKAADAFFEKTGIKNQGIRITIQKNIPSSAGLAGGSTDGAAVLVGLNKLFDSALTEHELCEIGQKIGADVPFCIVGGTALAQDIGQILSRLPDFEGYKIVLVKPDRDVSTKQAYNTFESKSDIRHIDSAKILHLCANSDYENSFRYFENVFEQLVEVPERVEIKSVMRQFNASLTLMSGSGPSVYGIFKNENDANECAKILKKSYRNVFVCNCVKNGCQFVE